jgi:chromosome segregation ATPase
VILALLGALLKRHWAGSSTSPSPPPEGGAAAAAAAAAGDIQRVMDEQAATIESLKKDKTTLETNLGKLQTDHERVVKENQVLRKAFQIQQERQSHAGQELETAKQYKAGAEEQIKKLDQIILSLRYHLQAQQHVSNDDFMGLSHRPPDVY